MGSYETTLVVNVLLSDDPTDAEYQAAFQAFFSQPFDGLFYDDFTTATFAFLKTCKAGRTDNAGRC